MLVREVVEGEKGAGPSIIAANINHSRSWKKVLSQTKEKEGHDESFQELGRRACISEWDIQQEGSGLVTFHSRTQISTGLGNCPLRWGKRKAYIHVRIRCPCGPTKKITALTQ